MGSYWRRTAFADHRDWHPPMALPHSSHRYILPEVKIPPELKELMRKSDENMMAAFRCPAPPAPMPLVKQLLDDAYERVKEQHREDFGRQPRAANSTDIPEPAPIIRSGEIWYGGMFDERNPRYELQGMLPKPKPPLSDEDLDWLETLARQHRRPKGDDPIHDGILSIIAEVRRRRDVSEMGDPELHSLAIYADTHRDGGTELAHRLIAELRRHRAQATKPCGRDDCPLGRCDQCGLWPSDPVPPYQAHCGACGRGM